MKFGEIMKAGKAVGFTGAVSHIHPNPYIINPFGKTDPNIIWIAKKYKDYADVIFVKEDECYRVWKE